MAKDTSIFAQLQVDSEQRQKLQNLDKKQLEIEKSDKEGISEYESNLAKMLSGKEEVKVANLSRLDIGIERGKKFKGEISDLAYSLTTELEQLGQFFGNLSQYKGLESYLAKFGMTRWANKKRLSRVKSSDVKQNLQTILDYGNHMVQKLYTATLENMECHMRIDNTIKFTAKKLEENQPLYEEWRNKKEILERKIAAFQDRMDKADATEFAKIAGEKAKLDKELQEASINEKNHFTIVEKAKNALPVQKTHLKAYADIVESLVQLRTGLEQNIENVTQLYLAVPTAIQTALGTKAASQYDKGMKYATDKATETVLASAGGILDESASRAERPLIEPGKLEAYRKMQHEMRTQFDTRMKVIEEKYAKSN